MNSVVRLLSLVVIGTCSVNTLGGPTQQAIDFVRKLRICGTTLSQHYHKMWQHQEGLLLDRIRQHYQISHESWTYVFWRAKNLKNKSSLTCCQPPKSAFGADIPKKAAPENLSFVKKTVANMCPGYGIQQVPRLCISNMPFLGFAYYKNGSHVLEISKELLEKNSWSVVLGVLRHELAHIAQGDCITDKALRIAMDSLLSSKQSDPFYIWSRFVEGRADIFAALQSQYAAFQVAAPLHKIARTSNGLQHPTWIERYRKIEKLIDRLKAQEILINAGDPY